MAERIIQKLGNPVLRKKCKPVPEITPGIITLLDDMGDTLTSSQNGAALAASQIGILKRIVIINNDDGNIELLNPEIVETAGEQIGPEGCLSIPGVWGKVKRAEYVKAKATDRAGKTFFIEGKGFMARCLQHEIDHLDGILYIDHVIPGQLFSEQTNEPLNVLDLIKVSWQSNI